MNFKEYTEERERLVAKRNSCMIPFAARCLDKMISDLDASHKTHAEKRKAENREMAEVVNDLYSFLLKNHPEERVWINRTQVNIVVGDIHIYTFVSRICEKDHMIELRSPTHSEEELEAFVSCGQITHFQNDNSGKGTERIRVRRLTFNDISSIIDSINKG